MTEVKEWCQAIETDELSGSKIIGKAKWDTRWSYLVGLRSGLTIHCGSITVNNGWAILGEPSLSQSPRIGAYGFKYGRPMEVRVSEIAWLADSDS